MSAHETQNTRTSFFFCLICASVQLRYRMAERVPPSDAWHGDGSTSIPLTHNSIPRCPYNLTRRGGNPGTWRPVAGRLGLARLVAPHCPWILARCSQRAVCLSLQGSLAGWPHAGRGAGRQARSAWRLGAWGWVEPAPACKSCHAVTSWGFRRADVHKKNYALVIAARTAIRRGRICARK